MSILTHVVALMTHGIFRVAATFEHVFDTTRVGADCACACMHAYCCCCWGPCSATAGDRRWQPVYPCGRRSRRVCGAARRERDAFTAEEARARGRICLFVFYLVADGN